MDESVAANTSRHCPSCNVMVRPQATFCHRCGRQIAPVRQEDVEFVNAAKTSSPAVASVSEADSNHRDFGATTFIETPEEPETVLGTKETPAPLSDAQSGYLRKTKEESENTISENPISENNEIAENKETAQPALKPKTRRVVKPVEYVWEESDSDPTWRLILFAVLAVAFVVLLFWLAHFIK